MSAEQSYTVRWALFGFRGRLSRKSFWLAALLIVLAHSALVAWATGMGTENVHGNRILSSGEISLILILFPVALLATIWSALALAVKRLHDLSLPAVLAILLLFPGISFFAFLFLAFMPSRQETNEHGPVPFPRN